MTNNPGLDPPPPGFSWPLLWFHPNIHWATTQCHPVLIFKFSPQWEVRRRVRKWDWNRNFISATAPFSSLFAAWNFLPFTCTCTSRSLRPWRLRSTSVEFYQNWSGSKSQIKDQRSMRSSINSLLCPLIHQWKTIKDPRSGPDPPSGPDPRPGPDRRQPLVLIQAEEPIYRFSGGAAESRCSTRD